MVDRGLHKRLFEPIVQAREFIQTFPTVKFYKTRCIYTLSLMTVDLCDADHLNDDVGITESAEIEIDDVYLDDLEFSQLRMIPRENFDITWMAKPKGRPYMTTKNQTWKIGTTFDDPRSNPANEYLQLNEIFQFEDVKMWIKATSTTGAAIANAYLEFFGYRFILESVKQAEIPKGIKPTVIPTEGWPGTETK